MAERDALTSLPQFETSLDKWFGRKNIPIWITEYGNETKPGEPKGVTEAQQAVVRARRRSTSRRRTSACRCSSGS